jgi:hypothetical protein
MACVRRAADGKLTADLPEHVGPFHVAAAADGAHLHRDGRTLDVADGKRLWDAFNRDVFGAGMALASYGMYSAFTCDDADKRSCIKLELWACQIGVDALGGKLVSALDRAGLGDAALSVDVKFLEPRGPKCRDGADCTPMQHYSTHGTYVVGAVPARVSFEAGLGTCADDGDCEPGGQACMAWYLTGGPSTTEYRQYDRPTFCGCVRHRCRWFHQH